MTYQELADQGYLTEIPLLCRMACVWDVEQLPNRQRSDLVIKNPVRFNQTDRVFPYLK